MGGTSSGLFPGFRLFFSFFFFLSSFLADLTQLNLTITGESGELGRSKSGNEINDGVNNWGQLVATPTDQNPRQMYSGYSHLSAHHQQKP